MMTRQSHLADGSGGRWLARLAGLAALAGLGRHLLFRAIERDAFVTPSGIPPTPDVDGSPISHGAIASGDRILRFAYARAARPSAPALLVFHGDDECLEDWAPVQALLSRAGIATFVFDYSGYGASTGRPTVDHLRQDALAAYDAFIAATPVAARRYVLGHSLGSGVLLEVARRLRPPPDGIVIAAGFSSARAAAVETGKVPAWLAWLLPDPWNNAARIRRIGLPLLIIHSRSDEVLPLDHARRLAQAAGRLHALVVLEGLPHDAAILPDYMESFWPPVIRFLLAEQGHAAMRDDDTLRSS